MEKFPENYNKKRKLSLITNYKNEYRITNDELFEINYRNRGY